MDIAENKLQKTAAELDAQDPLAGFRARFHMPLGPSGQPVVYFCGNSLGLQPKSTSARVQQELDDWAQLGVEGHFAAKHPWMPYHERLTASLARIVGAQPQEVVAMNSLTVNLHLLMASFYRPAGRRRKIAIEAHAFPSDVYAVKSQLRFHGFDEEADLLVLQPEAGHETISTQGLTRQLEAQKDDIALLLLGGVNYYTGQAFELEAITRAAQKMGITVGLDLAHAAGNIPLALHDWGVDFAAWCSYKYLNAGPGATAAIFVHERHLGQAGIPRFEGWWGHDKASRFNMPHIFVPSPTAEAWQLSNPAILPMAALAASLELFDEAGMGALRSKSEQMTAFLEREILALGQGRFRIITPSETTQRGCQLSIQVHGSNKQLFEALSAQEVVADWREPDVIRIAPVPLYNSFTDCAHFVARLQEALHATA